MKLIDAEIRALNALRRGPSALLLRSIAERAAAAAMEQYESTQSTDENRLQVAAGNAVVVALFTQAI